MRLARPHPGTGTVAFACILACSPGAASTEPFVVTPAREVALGERALEEFLAKRGVASDEAISLRVATLGEKVAAVSDRPDLAPTFLVVRGKELQAFSFAGGTIALTETLVALFASDDQLAFALAHELAHVVLRHHVATLRFEQAIREGGGSAAETPAPVKSFYDRGAELEADAYAALYVQRAGFAFSGAPEALERLAASLPNHDDAEHPDFESRIATLRSFRAELEKVLRAFDAGVAALRAGRADEAVERLTIFVAAFPNSFAGRLNLGAAYLGRARSASPLPSGLSEPLPLVPDHGIVLRSPAGPGDLLKAADHFDRARRQHPDSRPALLGLAAIKTRRGELGDARDLLNELLRRAPDDPEILLVLGNVDFVAGRLGDAASGYRAALTRRPGWSAARKNLALTLEASGDTVGARDLWSGLLDDPELRGEARIRLAALEPAR